MRERAEERDNRLEGRNIGGGGAGLHGVQVNVPMMQDNERYSCPAADLIRKRPVRPAEAHWDCGG